MIEWNIVIGFLLAIILVVINGVTQLIYAQSLGYKLKPTSLAYFVGAFGNTLTGNVVPIAAQAETLTISGLIKKMNVRVAALLIASIVGIIMGAFSLLSTFVDFAGESIIYGMMAGVGLLLSDTALQLMKKRKRVGILSIVLAFLVWVFTKDLIYTIAASVLISTIDFTFIQKKRVEIDTTHDTGDSLNPKSNNDWTFVKPLFNLQALLGGLSLICLNIGTNISFGTITSSIANKTPNFDHISLINSIADIPSILLGGMPIETIISGTAATHWPVLAGIIMMLTTGLLIFTGIIQKIGRYVPAESISGFLLVIGFSLTLIPNLIFISSADDAVDGFVSASVTVLTKNAFIGIVVALLVRFIRVFGGISL